MLKMEFQNDKTSAHDNKSFTLGSLVSDLFILKYSKKTYPEPMEMNCYYLKCSMGLFMY